MYNIDRLIVFVKLLGGFQSFFCLFLNEKSPNLSAIKQEFLFKIFK